MSYEVAGRGENADTLLGDARYWFDQYRYAAGWEARLIREIDELKEKRSELGREGERH